MNQNEVPGNQPADCLVGADVGGEGGRESLVRRHASAVLAVCLAHTRNVHDAEDLMQDTFVKAFDKLGSLQDREKAKPWLLQIARRLCVDHSRRRRPAGSMPDDVEAPVKSEDPRVERLQAVLGQMPEKYRETISLYYLDGRDCAGVAATLGVSESAVRQRLVRGRLMLHDLLTRDEQ